MANFRIEFYELVATATADTPNAFSGVSRLATSTLDPIPIGGYARELWSPLVQAAVVRGQFRKFRMDDLPEIGKLGAESEPLKLAENQGLVEKNYFALYKRQSLLAWHGNGHANTPRQFARVLSELLGTRLDVQPIIQANALKRLMAGKVKVRSLNLSVARPRNRDYFPETEFSQKIFDTLGMVDGDRLQIHVTTDSRINAEPYLKTKLKRAIKELVTDGMASTARVDAVEDGIEHPIDLIADRITSTQEIDYEGRYPPAPTMYDALDAAVREEREAIDAILGEDSGRLE